MDGWVLLLRAWRRAELLHALLRSDVHRARLLRLLRLMPMLPVNAPVDGFTPLMLAASNWRLGHEHIAALLERRADASAWSERRAIDCLRPLGARARLACPDPCAACPWLTPGPEELQMLQQLVGARADPNVRSRSSVRWAMTKNMSWEFVEALVSVSGRSLPQLLAQSDSLEGLSPLLWASQRRMPRGGLGSKRRLELRTVQELLAARAQVNGRDARGRTPLFAAVQWAKSLPVVRCLLKSRAQVNAQTRKRETALDMAVRWRRPKMARLLLASGAAVEGPRGSPTPLWWAVQSPLRSDDVVRVLLEARASVNGARATTSGLQTPLLAALLRRGECEEPELREERVRLLLGARAQVNECVAESTALAELMRVPVLGKTRGVRRARVRSRNAARLAVLLLAAGAQAEAEPARDLGSHKVWRVVSRYSDVVHAELFRRAVGRQALPIFWLRVADHLHP